MQVQNVTPSWPLVLKVDPEYRPWLIELIGTFRDSILSGALIDLTTPANRERADGMVAIYDRILTGLHDGAIVADEEVVAMLAEDAAGHDDADELATTFWEHLAFGHLLAQVPPPDVALEFDPHEPDPTRPQQGPVQRLRDQLARLIVGGALTLPDHTVIVHKHETLIPSSCYTIKAGDNRHETGSPEQAARIALNASTRPGDMDEGVR